MPKKHHAYKKNNNVPETVVKGIEKGVLTGVQTAAVMAGPELLIQRSQTSFKPLAKGSLVTQLTSAAAMMAAGYLKSLKASAPVSTIKSTTITVSQDKDLQKKLNPAAKKQSNDFMASAAISLGVGTADTALTQYHAVKGVIKREEHISESEKRAYTAPKPKTLGEKFKVGSTGSILRNTRNIATVSGYLAQQNVESKLDKHLPQFKGAINSSAATAITAVPFVLAGNVPDIMWKQKVLSLDNKFKSDSTLDLAKKMFRQGGAKAFVKGYVPALAYTAVAYQVLPKAQKGAEYLVENGSKLVKQGLDKLDAIAAEHRALRETLPVTPLLPGRNIQPF